MRAVNMTGASPGWYRDPAPANAADPSTVRFWDGQNWTGQTRLATRRERQVWREEELEDDREGARALLARAEAGDEDARQIMTAALADPGTRGTGGIGQTGESGDAAGFGRRAVAQTVDALLMGLISLAAGWLWIRRVEDVLVQYADDARRAASAGLPPPALGPLLEAVVVPLLIVVAIGMGVRCAYEVGFLSRLGATPGKLLLGLQVRRLVGDADLTPGVVLGRWLAKYGVGVLSVVPVVGFLWLLYWLADNLWPLWDGRRQALHDKVAGTVVVRR